jgi:flagellar basal-body rod protein FlgB
MDTMSVFDLAQKRAQWLAVRQQVVAGNVANANTPGYEARDLSAFTTVLDSSATGLATTNVNHFSDLDMDGSSALRSRPIKNSWDPVASGNSVSIEQEIVKAGDIAKDYAFATNVMRTMQRMWLMSAKG